MDDIGLAVERAGKLVEDGGGDLDLVIGPRNRDRIRMRVAQFPEGRIRRQVVQVAVRLGNVGTRRRCEVGHMVAGVVGRARVPRDGPNRGHDAADADIHAPCDLHPVDGAFQDKAVRAHQRAVDVLDRVHRPHAGIDLAVCRGDLLDQVARPAIARRRPLIGDLLDGRQAAARDDIDQRLVAGVDEGRGRFEVQVLERPARMRCARPQGRILKVPVLKRAGEGRADGQKDVAVAFRGPRNPRGQGGVRASWSVRLRSWPSK
jgi:hypothetical protein